MCYWIYDPMCFYLHCPFARQRHRWPSQLDPIDSSYTHVGILSQPCHCWLWYNTRQIEGTMTMIICWLDHSHIQWFDLLTSCASLMLACHFTTFGPYWYDPTNTGPSYSLATFGPISVTINPLWPYAHSTDQTIWADCNDPRSGLIQSQSVLLWHIDVHCNDSDLDITTFLHQTMPWLTTQVPFSALLPWGDCWLPPGDWIWLATRQTPHWNVTPSGAITLCPDNYA